MWACATTNDVDESTDPGCRRQPPAGRPTAAQLLERPDALLTRGHLRELGLERRAIDAVFRSLDVVVIPGYSRPLIRVRDYRALLDKCTHNGSRVR
jgi:hypothetical protein